MKKAYTTNDGYTKEISKHMSKNVFNKTNGFKVFKGNSKYKKPYKITFFELKQDSRKIRLNKIYIYMRDSISVSDYNNKEIGGYRNGLVKYTIKKINNTWCITDSEILVDQ
ncbi:hypothetical protein LN736_17110 [Clostridium sp. WLY-B-L2]|uniref:Uncharacterized protein n=2 Tax=Clostridium TaxID=1485 RepID=A0ABS8NA94_9CLOT|nr:hypothetical protein [Clostridium aromativorans]MCC9296566.1 hypothetical protein [Clostridium aromativorans]CAB1249121.1 hypothetical protein CLOSBL3_11832 [Clostridiaceae bacterium BL-3]